MSIREVAVGRLVTNVERSSSPLTRLFFWLDDSYGNFDPEIKGLERPMVRGFEVGKPAVARPLVGSKSTGPCPAGPFPKRAELLRIRLYYDVAHLPGPYQTIVTYRTIGR